jgi:hypothetical protein
MTLPKILIATPIYGAPEAASVSVAYHVALLSMAQSGQIMIAPHVQWISEDLVRVRCRSLRYFLEETDCTHLLFWDSDVGGSDPKGEKACCALALMGMIAEDVDLIGAPYPRKRIMWDQVRTLGADHAYSWPLRRLGPGAEVEFEGRKARVAGVPFGFALISRSCARAVSDACFSDGEWFTDFVDGRRLPTPLAFQLIVTADEHRQLLSEDNSFCQRAIEAGKEVWLYVGPGAPLDHVGAMRFCGDSRGLIGVQKDG